MHFCFLPPEIPFFRPDFLNKYLIIFTAKMLILFSTLSIDKSSVIIYTFLHNCYKGIFEIMKKLLSALLIGSFVLGTAASVFAADESSARFYNIYGDNMIFEQNCPAELAGTSTPDVAIKAEIVCMTTGTIIASPETTADTNGTFLLTFDAPAGGYDEYEIRLYLNGESIQTLSGVVFGEVWLASGQSNMEYPMTQDSLGYSMFRKDEALNKNIRVLLAQGVTPYNGNNSGVPYEPQPDIPNAVWVRGDSLYKDVLYSYNMSAVAYWFADKIQKQLNMPVGIINASLNASSMRSWLSREAIDGDPEVKAQLEETGQYLNAEKWNAATRSQASDMTANYNLKINALKRFTCTGMLWYQGEAEIAGGNCRYGKYTKEFNLLQSSYSEYFAKPGEVLPIIFSTLASYEYGKKRTAFDLNIEFGEIQKRSPGTRALISIYDVDLSYIEKRGPVHPAVKKPIGERMAYAAQGLVYGSYNTYTTATVKSVKTEADAIYVKFSNTGSGLVSGGKKLLGFTAAGSDGVYLPADAEIISTDTVKISSSSIKDIKSVAYVYSYYIQDANLYALGELGYKMPVGCFITKKLPDSVFPGFTSWQDCEASNTWRVLSPVKYTGFYDLWQAQGADIACKAASAFSGNSGLKIITKQKKSTVKPVFRYTDDSNNTVMCSDVNTDWSNYGTVSFMIKNNGAADVTISSLKVFYTDKLWFTPLTDSGSVSYKIPSDGMWHKAQFDLNSLKIKGSFFSAKYANEKLTKITGFEICLSGVGADLSIDEVRFTSDGRTTGKTVYSPFALFNKLYELFNGVKG